MISILLRGYLAVASASMAAVTLYAGGWVTVTVKDMPENLVAGKPAELRFLVRQHGVSPLDGLTVAVRATAPGGTEAKAFAKSVAGAKGEYTALLTVPSAGDWTIRIDTDWPATPPLLPVTAIPDESSPPAALSRADRGKRFFVSKACLTCHVNKDVSAKNLLSAGPELTGRTFQPDYLRKFLADPAGTLGKASPPRVGEMPNQQLTAEEIDALVAFINRERTQVVSRAR
jgi:mono/diheme cytochrome c family protein